MFGKVPTECFVHRRRITEHPRDVRLQEHDVGPLFVALIVLPAYSSTEIVLWSHVVVGRRITSVLLHSHDVLLRSLPGR